MKSRFLFSNQLRPIGYVLFVVGISIFCIGNIYSSEILQWQIINKTNGSQLEILTNDMMLLLLIAGLILIAFTKEKIEDERILQVRLDSLQWAVYCNYLCLIICIIVFNGLAFFSVMVYNMFIPLVFFILRFRFKLIMYDRSSKSEQLT
ncbi:hypothetical protein EON73_05110 [bacterium]|nr:MAG: hypothetical protein EON73_05110 [bacterium]